MNPDLLRLVGNDPAKYPKVLEERFPRVLEKIATNWEKPSMAVIFAELLINDTHDRAGFPPEAAREIFSLSMIHEAGQQSKNTQGYAWQDIEEARAALEEAGIPVNNKSFSRAVESGNGDNLKLLLRAGMNVDERDERDWTPLMIAAFNGNENIALILIEHNAKVDAQDRRGYTPLHWASINGFSKVVKLLIEKGADVNAQSQAGWTPLIQAAAQGHLVVMALLIAEKTNVDHLTNDGWTALHKAAANGQTDAVKLLLKNGANPNLVAGDGSVALDLAIKQKHPDTAEIIREFLATKGG